MSTLVADRPATATKPTDLWVVRVNGQGRRPFLTPERAATYLVDQALACQHRGEAARLDAQSLGEDFLVLWDATADVESVFRATGWPSRLTLADRFTAAGSQMRDEVIQLVRCILVAE